MWYQEQSGIELVSYNKPVDSNYKGKKYCICLILPCGAMIVSVGGLGYGIGILATCVGRDL